MALAGWDVEEMSAALPAVLDLAAASGADLGITSDIVTDALSAFGMEAEDAVGFADLLASASANSNTNVEMLGESFKYVAPVMGALGVSADDTALALGLMANAGIKGGQAGTQLRTIMTSLVDPTDQQAAAMEKYGVEMVKNADGSINLEGTMGNLRETLGGLDEEQQAAAASTIFGKNAMAGALAIVNASEEDYKKLSSATSDYDGAAADMAATMQDNLKGSFEELKSALSEAAISMGQALVPAIQKVVDAIMKMVDWFNNLDDGTKQTIAVVGLLIAALGPMIFIAGKVTAAVKFLSGAFAAATGTAAATSAGMGALAKAIGFLSGPGGIAVAAIGGIAIASKKLYDHFSQDAIPEVERFGEVVSEETQAAVGNFMDMSEGADVALKEMAWSQQEVTQEMAENMREKQEEITTSLLEAIDDRHGQEREATVEQFEHIESLSEEQKAKILEKVDERFKEESEMAQKGHDRINEIMQKAADEGREISQEESDEILKIRDDMTKQAVDMMSQNELEQKTILEKMKQNSTTITAQEAVEVAKNSQKKKEDVIKEANEQYDETVAWAIQQRDETGALSAEEAADIIAEAKNKRDGSVTAAEDMHAKVVAEAQAQAGDAVRVTEDGNIEVLSKWDVLVRDVGTKATQMKDDAIQGFEQMVQGTKNEMRVVVATVKKSMGDALSVVTDKISEFKEAGSNIASGIADGIRSGIENVKSAAGSLAQAARDFLPFSPAKEGPLKDLDKLDFGGPIQKSIDKAIPNIRAEMNHILRLPNADYTKNAGVGSNSINNSKTYGDTNITIVSPKNTPSENAREIKRVGRELSLGY